MLIRDEIISLLEQALKSAEHADAISSVPNHTITVEHPNRQEHGNFSSNLPLKIQGLVKIKALDLAKIIIEHIPPHDAVERVEIAPPGFINFFLDDKWVAQQASVIARDNSFGQIPIEGEKSLQIEYVSANPTGPIHVGNGRGAAIGSTLANTFKFTGYQVQQEYYINDAGNQVLIFGQTLYARYLQLHGNEASLPDNGYPGSYMIDLAQEIKNRHGEEFLEQNNDSVIEQIGVLGIEIMVEQIKKDLEQIGVEFDSWFSEKSLMEENSHYDQFMSILTEKNQITERDGAVWFASSELGESKDNVLVRSDGTPTYYATDIAYHYEKFIERRFDRVIDIWGADHQGHVSRLKAAIDSVGGEPDALDVLLYQLVTLRRGDEIVPLSKRAGEIVTLANVVAEVGEDAARYFFLATGANQPMEFDLELAVTQSDDNPVYYIQYAHARISSILDLATEQKLDAANANTELLTDPAEIKLIVSLLLFPEIVERVLSDLAPHHLAHYARELAAAFHNFYGQCRVVQIENPELSSSRLLLLEATKSVLARILDLMGISAPKSM
ncbi:MAG: arginine--tRNA ligase [Dehalococcoidia bacterium]|nr:arginine--tRNA ligase [Dehalococcoidia bacterium]